MQKEIRAHFSALCCLTRVAFVVLYTTIFLARSIVHTIFGQNSLTVLSKYISLTLCCFVLFSLYMHTNIFVYFRTEKKLASWRGRHVAAHLFIFDSSFETFLSILKNVDFVLGITLSSISLFRAITKRYKSFQILLIF